MGMQRVIMRPLSRNLVQLTNAETADFTLICMPWAGAGATPFRAWAQVAPPNVRLVALRLAGRESRLREPCPDSFFGLIDELVSEVGSSGATAFFGHCLGALIAFEVTRRLRAGQGPAPARLLVVGEPPFGFEQPPIADLEDELRRSQSMPTHALDDPVLYAHLAPAISADLGLASQYRYVPEPALDLSIDVFVPSADTDHARASRAAAPAWARESTGETTVHLIEGENLFPHGAWSELGQSVLARAVLRG